MKIFKVWNDDPSEKQLREIAQFLKEGEIAIIPTDTLYAIACDATNPKAIEKICRMKNINPDKTNLSIICADISMASEYSRFDNYAYHLMRDNCPGAFTFLFKAASVLPKAFKGRKTVGIRIPANNVARQLANYLTHPLMVTSIEYADEDYAVNPELIAEAYDNHVDVMVDGGNGNTVASTIVDCRGHEPIITREGAGKLI